MKAGYAFLIAASCVVPAFIPLLTLAPKAKDHSADDDGPEVESFRDLIFKFETSFIQTVYTINQHLVALSPQSAMIMLWIMGFGAPDDIQNQLHDKMKLETLKFQQLIVSNSPFRKGIEGLLHNYQSAERHQVLGWTWNMTVNISDQCVEQVPFIKLLKVFNSSITNHKEKEGYIQTLVTESFNPQLSKFYIHCIYERKTNQSGPSVKPIRSLVSTRMRFGNLPSLDNIPFYELPHENVSIYFLQPNGTDGLNKIISNFSNLDYKDFQTRQEKRSHLKLPIGRWTNLTWYSEYRPFLLKTIPTYGKKTKIIGDFRKVCDLNKKTEHVYNIMGEVTLIFRTDVNGTTNLPKCDMLEERKRKSQTAFFKVKYPFIILIMINKSIIYFDIIRANLN